MSSGAVTVRDLGSKNGTFVNGLRVERTRLAPGDWLQVGPVKLLLEEVDPGDTRLGIAVEWRGESSPAPASSGADTQTNVRGPHEAPSGWLETLEAVLEVAEQRRPGVLHEALDELVRGICASGALLAELGRGPEPVALAAAGETTGLADAWAREGRAPVTRVEQPGPDGGTLVLLVQGDFPGREAAPPLLRIVLRLLAANRPANHPSPRAHSQKSATELRHPPGAVVGRSPAARALQCEIVALVGNDLPVLLVGETGVGKEVVARTLHLSSPRSTGPFVALNCAAIPSELLEAELFGVVRGAATGVLERRGAFELAGGGVLLLDEIGDMPLPLQAKLLRALQEREVLPVGAGAARPFDVRLVSATNTDIDARVERGSEGPLTFLLTCG